MHLSLQSNSATKMTYSFEMDPTGNFGYIAENDSPTGNVASGNLQKQDTASFDTAAGHVAGPWIFRHGNGRIGQVTFTASTSTTATVSGEEDDSSANHDTITNGSITIDGDGSGHATITLPLTPSGTTLHESIYLVEGSNRSGTMYMMNQGQGSGNTPTGALRFQAVSSGYTDANAFTGSTAMAIQGLDSAGNASVYIGQFALSTLGPGFLTGGIDYNDGGTTKDAGYFGGASASYTMDSAGTGRGTMGLNGTLQGAIQLESFIWARRAMATFSNLPLAPRTKVAPGNFSRRGLPSAASPIFRPLDSLE